MTWMNQLTQITVVHALAHSRMMLALEENGYSAHVADGYMKVVLMILNLASVEKPSYVLYVSPVNCTLNIALPHQN